MLKPLIPEILLAAHKSIERVLALSQAAHVISPLLLRGTVYEEQ